MDMKWWNAGRFFPRTTGHIPVGLRKLILLVTVPVLLGIMRSLLRFPKLRIRY